MRRIAWVTLLLAVVIGLAQPACADDRSLPAPEGLSHRGPFLTDNAGRVVLIHGINAVYKHAPYVAPATARGLTRRDARFMKRHGINAVRLGVLFAGVMPTEGKIDHGYLRKVDRIVRLLTRKKIWVLLDFHQDAFNEKFEGEGFPDWAVHDDGLPFMSGGNFFVDGFMPAVQRNYDHLYANDFGLADRYAEAWRAVAKKWRGTPYLMGYDLLNEPNPGSTVATCLNPLGCPAVDATLQAFYERIRKQIRTVDRTSMVWYEPHLLFNAISASNFTKVSDEHVGFSWHNYACLPAFVNGGVIPGDPDCEVNQPRVMDNAAAQAERMGGGSLLTEFGAGDDLEDLARITGFADDALVGWMYWAYKLWDDPTGSQDEGLFLDDANPHSVKRAKLRTLVRPYPQATAGTPTSLSWDHTSKVMRFTYTPDRKTGLTDVFVPWLTYGRRGYRVTVTDGQVVRGLGRRHLMIDARAGVATVSVVVRPRRA